MYREIDKNPVTEGPFPENNPELFLVSGTMESRLWFQLIRNITLLPVSHVCRYGVKIFSFVLPTGISLTWRWILPEWYVKRVAFLLLKHKDNDNNASNFDCKVH